MFGLKLNIMYTFNPFSARTVCRHQILTHKTVPALKGLKTIIMAVDLKHLYSNEAEIAN